MAYTTTIGKKSKAQEKFGVEITMDGQQGFEVVARIFRSLDVQKFTTEEIAKAAFRVERFAKQLAPVDTGRLRASIHTGWLSRELGAFVRTNTEYAAAVHEGRRKGKRGGAMRPRPFMTEGARLAEQYLAGDIKAKLDTEFTRAFKKL